MRIHLVTFAMVRQEIGHNRVELDLPPESTIAELKAVLSDRWPNMTNLVSRSAFAVNHNYAPDHHSLQEDDEVGWIPPVSGG